MDQRVRAVEGEYHVCKGAQNLGEKTHQAVDDKPSTQVIDVEVEDSTPDMLVRVLNHIAPLDFIESNGQTRAGLEVPNPSLVIF